MSELLAVLIIILGLLALAFELQMPAAEKQKAQRINCLNNLKQVGVSYRAWSADHGDLPWYISVSNGGTKEIMGTADAWRTYQVMSNELGTPKLLYCSADEECPMWATNFSTDLKGKISYFIGVDASTNLPNAFLSGDDNFAVAGQPVHPGFINLAPNTPVAWTAARHHFSGNIGLADGSAQIVGNSMLTSWIRSTNFPPLRLAIP